MSRQQHKEDLIRFLRTIQIAGRPIEQLDESASLIDSGLIDSLAILEIVLYLERTHDIHFDERGFDPDRLRSMAKILDLIGQQAT